MTDRDKIALGECVSELTTDRCPVCVDRCEAFQNYCKLGEELNKHGIKRNNKNQ